MQIRIDPTQSPDKRFTVRSLRPVTAARVFVGRSLKETVTALPRLYNICGGAQAVAALTACEYAAGIQIDDRSGAARALLLRVEAIREHLWRILIDWPLALDLPTNPAPVARAMQADNMLRSGLHDALALGGIGTGSPPEVLDALRAIAIEHVFGEAPETWLNAPGPGRISTTENRIQALSWEMLGRTEISALPVLGLDIWDARLRSDHDGAFATEPGFDAQPYETGSLARQLGHPLLAGGSSGLHERWRARLIELAMLLCDETRLHSAGLSPEHGQGIASVEAARGTLIHRVEQRDGNITRYQIVAPTEWNFHPQGALSRSLATLDSNDPDTLKRQTRALVTAIDPCVAFRIEIVGDTSNA
ncbi:MAG: nickel-dependent hydrogenase large subunit [Gammaproteobacteria bacterium]|nr:nickel-dependent hydrogenase large subunit [Gammaproteobacteria bacterium]